MKKGVKKRTQINKIIIGIIIAFVVLIISGMTFYKATGMTITIIAEEEGVFEVVGGKVTQEYILVGIKNIGTRDYFINEISITDCGKIAGENISLDGMIKVFSVQCNDLLEKDTEFKGNLTITCSCEEFTNKTQTITILGNVSSKKCFYGVENEEFPIIMNECVNQEDCTQQIYKVRDSLNEQRIANNQSEINLKDISVLDCSY